MATGTIVKLHMEAGLLKLIHQGQVTGIAGIIGATRKPKQVKMLIHGGWVAEHGD